MSQAEVYNASAVSIGAVTTSTTGTAYVALSAVNAIKTSIATVAAPVTYTTFNGYIGGTFSPSCVMLTSSSNAGSYTADSTVIFTGTLRGAVATDTLTLTGTDGGQTIYGTTLFDTVTSIAIQAQANTSGAFQFGLKSIPCVAVELRNDTGTTLEYQRATAGIAFRVITATTKLIQGITNIDQITVRRTDVSNTPVTAYFEVVAP